jgi:hypothetical protein
MPSPGRRKSLKVAIEHHVPLESAAFASRFRADAKGHSLAGPPIRGAW